MLTRQAISPVSLLRRAAPHIAVALVVIVSLMISVATAAFVLRPLTRVAIERGPVEQVDRGEVPIAGRDFGDITSISGGWTLDTTLAVAPPKLRDLKITPLHDSNLTYLNAVERLPPAFVPSDKRRSLTVGPWPDRYDGGVFTTVDLEADDWSCAKNERGRWTCTRGAP